MQFRIGDRDPATGLYCVIWPDGSQMLNGLKIFNAAHAVGDVVLATQRSDGMMVLDSVKAVTDVPTTVTRDLGLQKFGEQPVGYLHGQVWNNEDEPILPIVSVKFAPGSPTELAPNAGNFVVRIKIDRPQRRDLRIKVELTGTAPSGDYTVTGLDDDLSVNAQAQPLRVVVPVGELYFDVVIRPIQNSLNLPEIAILKLLQDREYRIGPDDSVTATIAVPKPVVSLLLPSYGPNFTGTLFQFLVSVDRVQSEDLAVQILLTGNPLVNYGVSIDLNQDVIIPAGQQNTGFTIQVVGPGSQIGQSISLVLQTSNSYDRGSSIGWTITIVPF